MRRSIVIMMMALFIASCRKEESNPVGPVGGQEKVTDYYPLTVGSYWIYEYYTADSTLNFIDQNITDSVYIEKDSICNGNTYAVFCSSYWSQRMWPNEFLVRDSSEYIVSNDGTKWFTINQNNTNLIERYSSYPDTNFFITWKMNNVDSMCTVPLGQYQAKYLIGTYTSRTPVLPSMEKRNYYYAYAKNIGQVYKRLGYQESPQYFEERLVRYHIVGTTN